MSVGCPVITSTNSSLPEVVGKATLLVDPYNIKEIAEAISQILSNNQLWQNLISKGYEQVKNYSWQKSAQKMLEAFRNL
jgi:glycosyltransferase involved in cell wall biosynthesis